MMPPSGSSIVGKFRCLRCGEPAMVTKSSQDVSYCYSIDCTNCGHWALLTQKHFDVIKQCDDYLPLEPLVLNRLTKSSTVSAGVGGNAK